MTAPTHPSRPNPATEADRGWELAVRLATGWREGEGRADHLLEDTAGNADAESRGAAQRLFFGAIRHQRRIDEVLGQFVARRPRPRLAAVLAVAVGELIENPAVAPALVVDHAVEQAKRLLSAAEARLVNAVLRRAVPVLRGATPPPADATDAAMAAYFSHPDWLVAKWLGQFGREATRRLLEWNQTPAATWVRWRAADVPPPSCLEAGAWPGFFRLAHGRWTELLPAIAAGRCYLQDPATRLAVEAAAPSAQETVLDLCAAPGGKSFQLADLMGRGRLVAVDRPGGRMKRIEQNLVRWRAGGGRTEIALVASDVEKLDTAALAARGLPGAYDVVVLDAPCSNSGVLRHRVDAKWRLQPGEFSWLAEVQGRLLARAAAFVRPAGRLVYSTCSLEPEENEQVVDDFLAGAAGASFRLDRVVYGRPWLHGHDGAGVFRLQRTG